MIPIANLTTLTPTEKEVLRKHCELSGGMHRLRKLRMFLGNEILEKRAVQKRIKFKIHQELRRPYDKIIFMGKKDIHSFQVFPCSYKGTLDSLLFNECHNTNIENALTAAVLAEGYERPCLTRFYYAVDLPIQELQNACKFDETEWSLGDPADDITILNKFRDELLAYMRRVEEVLEQTIPAFQNNRDIRELRKERRRYARVCGVLDTI